MIAFKNIFDLIIVLLVFFKNANGSVIKPTESSSPWVLVIGAGPAGIAAATRLYERGITNITILEAEDRIGGRVYTTTFRDGVVDMGAQWCHGQDNNVVYQMVKDLDVLSEDTMNDLQIIVSNGQVIDEKIKRRLSSLHENITENSKPEPADYSKSLGHFFTQKYYEGIKNDAILSGIDSTLADQYLVLFQKFQNVLDASENWFESSLRGNELYEECPGNQNLNWKNRGFKTIIDVLMKKFPDSTKAIPLDDKILLNKEVSNIDWGQNDTIKVKTVDNEVFEPDYVIFTPSLGVLKERFDTMFTPSLPQSKVNAIQSLGFGTVAKIYLHFDEPWWPENWSGFSLLWTEEDKEAFKGNKSWITDITGFNRVEEKPHLLMGWLTGTSARLLETLTIEEVELETMELIKRSLVNGSYNITKPAAVKTTSWYSNPHFRGSYSYRTLAADQIEAFPADIAEPLTKSNNQKGLLFAGEATHSHYYSTVHGAIESGWREANAILSFRN